MIARTHTPALTWIPLSSSDMDLGPGGAGARNHRPGRDVCLVYRAGVPVRGGRRHATAGGGDARCPIREECVTAVRR